MLYAIVIPREDMEEEFGTVAEVLAIQEVDNDEAGVDWFRTGGGGVRTRESQLVRVLDDQTVVGDLVLVNEDGLAELLVDEDDEE